MHILGAKTCASHNYVLSISSTVFLIEKKLSHGKFIFNCRAPRHMFLFIHSSIYISPSFPGGQRSGAEWGKEHLS